VLFSLLGKDLYDSDRPAMARRPDRRDAAALALLVVGLAAMAGDGVGSTPLKGVALATMASPLPKVFSAVEGYETFAARFMLIVERPDGEETVLELTPEAARALRGPYNRRNVYGAALAYAPRLPRPVWEAVFCYGFAAGGPLRAELGIPAEARWVTVEIVSKTRGSSDSWRLEARCAG
jgi:hypothetical protein